MTLEIRARQCYWEVRAQLLLSCCPALGCCSSSLPQFPLCQNWRSNAAGLYSLSWGRITNYSSGSISEHRFKEYWLVLFPSCKTLFQGGISLQTFPSLCSFLREAEFVHPVPNINLRVFLLYVINYISVLALNFISHASPQQESSTFSFTSSWRWIISRLIVYNSCEDSTTF